MTVDYSVSRAYSYNGKFPEELSHNWKSPDGEWLNLRVMTDEDLAELGWLPAVSPEYDPNTHRLQWNEATKSYDVVELAEPAPEPADYIKFWDLLLASSVYTKLKEQSKVSIEINALTTEFLVLLADAKFGNEKREAIQSSINEILSTEVFELEELAELQSIFVQANLDQYYTLG
jgi:hypothetical protein